VRLLWVWSLDLVLVQPQAAVEHLSQVLVVVVEVVEVEQALDSNQDCHYRHKCQKEHSHSLAVLVEA
jgi:hypothetical protein